MTELSLHILDVAYNSISAGAKLLKIILSLNREADEFSVVIADDGRGMSPEFLSRVTDPFTTSRKERRVGLGLPLFKMAAETAGGHFRIESKEGIGTRVEAVFKISHVDRQPLGDMALTIATLIGGAGETEILFEASSNGEKYVFDTREIKAVLDGIDIKDVGITGYLKEMISENLEKIFGGILL